MGLDTHLIGTPLQIRVDAAEIIVPFCPLLLTGVPHVWPLSLSTNADQWHIDISCLRSIQNVRVAVPCVPWLIFQIMSTFLVEAAVEVIIILRSAYSSPLPPLSTPD